MKNLPENPKSKQVQRFVLLGLCLVSSLLARNVGAAYITWDPQGTTGGVITSPTVGGYTGSMSQTWENAEWSTSQTGQATPQVWVDSATGSNAVFAVQANGNTPAFTVTMNANHTVSGIFDGPETPDPCTVTISGTGTMMMPSGTAGFDITSDTGDPGSLTVNVVIGGGGGIEGEGSGSIILNGANTFSGGFFIGGSGGVSFGNSAAFGTGAITWLTGGFIQPAAAGAVYNITNAMTNLATTETFSGNTGGTTFSGPWTLPASGTLNLVNIASSVTVAGTISGSSVITLTNRASSTWIFTGTNTYTNSTVITNLSSLTIGGSGSLGSGSYAGTITNTGTFIYASSASQTLSGVISGAGVLKQTNGTLTLSANNTYSGGTTLSGGTTAIGTFNTPFGSSSGTITLSGGSINATLNRGTTGTSESILSPLLISGNSQLQAFPTVANSIRYLQFGSTVSSTAGSLTITNGGTVGSVFCVVLTNAVTLNVPVILTNAVAGNIPQLGTWNYSAVGDQIFNGVISGNGAIYRSTELAAGTGARAIFTAANTYSGGISNNDGEIACGISSVGTPDSGVTSGALGTGPMTVGNGNGKISAYGGAQVVGNHVILSSSPLTFTGTNSLTMSGNFDFGSVVRTLAVSNTNLTELSGSILNGGLTVSGGNTLTLAGASAYTSATTVSNNSTLALTSNGSISNSASLAILAGSTFNVSAISAYALSSSTALSASGTTTPATIKGPSGGTVSLGSQPITLAFDGTNAALTISQGTLVLSNNAFTINGSALAVGNYTVAHQTSGNITSLSATYPTPTGTAIGTGTSGFITVSGGNVILTIQSASTTSVSSSTGGTSTYGQPVTFSATVTRSDGGGTVAFYADASPTPIPGCSAIPLTAGVAMTPSISNLGAGVHTISATYSGDAASTSSSGSLAGGQTVNPLPVVLTGTRAYDGTNDVSATILTISNNLDGANLTLSGSGTLAGSSVGMQNISSFAGFALGGSVATNYTLTGASGSVTITSGNSTFSGLTASQSVIYGTPTITLSGTVSATGPIYPTSGETITVTINGNAQTTTLSDSTGDFSINYNLSGIIYSANPYTITYSYAGDSSFQAASNTSTTLTINPPAGPVITTNPLAQTVCNGSSATFSVAASGTNSYAWYDHLNAGWGSVWSATGGGGTFLGSSTTNNNGAPSCNSFSTNGDIDTSSSNSWGLSGGPGGETVVRTFPTVLTNGQVFQIDMDNGGVANGVQNGFALQNSNGAFLFSFYFLGGGSDYVYSDSAAYTTSIGATVTGLRIQVIVGTNTLGSPAAYSLLVTPCGGSTVEYSGVFAASNGPGQVVLFNNNPSNDPTNNLYFNNMFAGLAYDDADNYSGNWGGSDEGDASPISGATNTSYTTSTGNNGDLYYAIAYNGAGDAASATALLTINPRPTAVVSGSASICNGGSNTVSAVLTGTAPWNVTWSDGTQQGGVTSSPVTYSPSPSSTTTYTVTNLTDANCMAQAGDLTGSAVVTVNPVPTVSVNSATACAGSSVTLTATTSASSPGYLWSPGGATTASITVSPSSTTTYTVTVTDGTTGCTNSASGTMTVNPVPTVSVNSAAICPGSSATLTATTSASSPSYLWSPGGATTASITVSPSSTTNYTVTVTDGTTGCDNSAFGTVTVNPSPTISLGASPVLSYGSSTNASFPYTATSGGPDEYSIAYDSNAQTAGFSNVALASLPVSPIMLAVPSSAGTNSYNGILMVSTSSTGCSSTNYAFTVTITPGTQTITFGSLSNQTYGAAPFALSATASSGLAVSFSVVSGPASITNNTITITGTGLISVQASQAGDSNYSAAVPVTNSFTVNPLPVILTGAQIYNGTATVPAAILSVSNAVGGDNVTVASGSTTMASANAGTNPLNLPGTLMLGGTSASNYTLTGASGSVVVAPLPVVLTGSRSYDGTAIAASTILTVSNKIGSDVVTLASGSANLVSSNAGPEAITSPGTLVLGGASAADYTLIGATGTVIISSGVTYWDPTGATVSATPNGTWEGSNWAPTKTLTASTFTFPENNAAGFAAGTGATGSYTVTANANHTIAGIFDGGLSDSTGTVTINGPGILTIFSGVQGFYTASGGSMTINAQLSGSGGLENEASGSLFLYASNSYSGGTYLGSSAGLNFNNNNSFGTGPIVWFDGTTSTVLATPAATASLTITNPVITTNASQIFVGVAAAPVTFSGPWTLPALASSTTGFQNQPAGTVVTISGIISGAAGFTKKGAGTLILSGTNNYTGATTDSAGTLALGAGGSIGASAVTVSSGATLANFTTTTASIGGATVLNPAGLAAFTATGGVSSVVGQISITGNLTLNTNAMTVTVSGGSLAAGSYRLMTCTGILTGPVGTAIIAGPALSSGYTASLSANPGSGGHVDLIVKATPVFSGLSSPSIMYGASSVTLSGTVSSTSGPTTIYPALGDTVSATINGYLVNGSVTDSIGDFSITYNDPSLATDGVSSSPYTITYVYGGNAPAFLNAATDTSTTLTVNPAALSITANNDSKIYGQTKIYGAGSTAFTNGPLQNGETIGSVTLASSGAAANAPVSGSPYNITPSAATGGTFNPANYSINYIPGALTVAPLPVILTGTRAYDGTATAAASILSVSNNVGSDNVTVASGSGTLASASVGSEALTSVGTLALGGTAAGNYTLTGATGAVTITNSFNPFSITSAALDSTGTNLVVCWQSVPGVSYNVLTNTSVGANGSWVDLGPPQSPVTATTNITCVTIPGTTNTNAFVLIKQ